jgi:trichothecene 3-O-acetyltransferase
MSKLPLDALTGPSGSVGQVAAVINSNAGRVSWADLLNLYNLLSHTSSYDELIRMKRLRTSTIDGNDMSISSLMNIPMHSLCFGVGTEFGNKGFVEAARLLMGTINKWTRTCVVLPKLKNGGVEFLVNLRDEEFTLLIENQHFIQFALYL